MDRLHGIGPALAVLVIVGACAAAASPSVAPTTQAPTAAAPTSAPQTSAPTKSPAAAIHLTEQPTSGAGVSVGSLSGCAAVGCLGDYIVGLDPVVDAATGKVAGELAYECFLVDTTSHQYHCPGTTIDLTGRGQIAFTDYFFAGGNGQAVTAPITGGTGEFLGATGSIVIKQLPGPVGDYVITFVN
jgi:hypothetical protein